ncbi:MAG: AAA family ATPase [Byssovorax sp.]
MRLRRRRHVILTGWAIYHDIHVDQQAPLRHAAIARLDRRVATDGHNLIPVLHTLYTGSRDFKKLVDDAMRAAFSKDYEELVFPPPAADQRVQLRIRWRSLKTEQSAADLSDGTIRFLLLLAILGNPTPGSLISIDEPEIGLHPSMLPIVAELAVDASERTQVILTTHSPQLLDAFTGTPPTTTVAQCVDGETRLAVVDSEELQRWLGEYTLGALFRSGELEGMV